MKYTREQLEERLKVVNNKNKKDLEKEIKKYNLINSKKEINHV